MAIVIFSAKVSSQRNDLPEDVPGKEYYQAIPILP
jgi:hypothetical protein